LRYARRWLSSRAAEPWNGVREPAAYLMKVAVTRGKLMLVERGLRPYLDYSACRGKLDRAGTKGIADDLCPPQIELQEVGK
jgi:hypothetical protein